MKVLATYSIKGGVGKTASAVNLARLAAADGHRTLLWDLDPQGAATYCFRVKPKVRGGCRKLVRGKRPLDRHVRGTDFDGLDLLPADFSYRHLDLALDAVKRSRRRLAELVRPLGDAYDWVFLDCAPSISLVSEAIFRAADALLVPTVPTPLSLRMLDKLVRYLARRDQKVVLLPFFCMVDRRKALHREILEGQAAKTFGFLKSSIPYSSVVERMGAVRAPLEAFARTTTAARAYASLWAEIVARLATEPR